jgi:hypothetical protein
VRLLNSSTLSDVATSEAGGRITVLALAAVRWNNSTHDLRTRLEASFPSGRVFYCCAGQVPIFGLGNCLEGGGLNDPHTRTVAMRIQTYRDKSRSRHFDLIYGGVRARSIDLVS